MTELFASAAPIGRLAEINYILARHGVRHVAGFLIPSRNPLLRLLTGNTEDLLGVGHRLHRILQDLGPTYIKLGQLLSTRRDLLPPGIIRELEYLQDSIRPVPFREVYTQIAAELDRPVESVFEHIMRRPIGSASIAQVHRARLRTGDDVVIKVQRPGIEQVIENDILLLKQLLGVVERAMPEPKVISPLGVLEELGGAIRKEMDFTLEADNCERFQANFAKTPGVHFPHVYRDYTTKRILTLQYIEATKITEVSRFTFDRRALARRGLTTVLKMIFQDGFFHADPHPANIYAINHDELVIFDHGMVGAITPRQRHHIVALMMAVAQREPLVMARAFQRMGAEIGIDTEHFHFADFLEDLTRVMKKHDVTTIDKLDIVGITQDALETARTHHLHVPTNYTLLLKSLLTIEAIGKYLDPYFNLADSLEEFFGNMAILSAFGNKPGEAKSATAPQRRARTTARTRQSA